MGKRRHMGARRQKGYVIKDQEVDDVMQAVEEKRDLSIGEQHVLALIEDERFKRGLVYMKNKMYGDAVKEFQTLIDLAPDSAEAYYNMSLCLQKMGRHDEALNTAVKANQAKREWPDGYFNQGICLANLGRHKDAVISYEKALTLRNDWPEAQAREATSLLALGERAKAIELLEAVIEAKPELWTARLNLGMAYKRNGDIDAAIECWRGVVDQAGGAVQANYELALAYVAKGYWAEAVTFLQKTVKLSPQYKDAPGLLARVQWGQAVIKDAATNELLIQAPDMDLAKARFNLGLAMLAIGRPADALRELEEAIRARPDWVEARYWQGQCYAQDGRIDSAMEIWLEILDRRPTHAVTIYQVVVAMFVNGRMPEADQYLEQARKLGFDVSLLSKAMGKG
jgi:tetratricopeptide (TPR) repeat protein